MNNVMEQLMALRGLTKTTGILHEAQVYQMKLYPLVMLSNAKSSQFTFDWEGRTVTYEIACSGDNDADLDKRLTYIDKAIKTLLGEDYTVVVDINGANAYVGIPIVSSSFRTPVYEREKFEEAVWRKNFKAELERVAEHEGIGRQAGDSEGKTKPD